MLKSDLLHISQYDAYKSISPSNKQILRLIVLKERKVIHQQILYMDGEVMFKRTITEKHFKNFKNDQIILFEKAKI